MTTKDKLKIIGNRLTLPQLMELKAQIKKG